MQKSYDLEMTVSWKWKVKVTDEQLAKNALEGYNALIKDSDFEDMLQHIAWNVGLRGTKDVEGVGHVTVNGYRDLLASFENAGIDLVPEWEEESEYEVNPIKNEEDDKEKTA